MSEGAYAILGVIIGAIISWLTSLLSPKIRALIQKPSIKRSLTAELEGVRYRLALVSLDLFAGSGTEIRNFLEWLIPVLRSYKGVDVDNELAERISGLLKLSDRDLASLPEYRKLSRRAISIKKFALPFLNSQVSNLSIFSLEFQQRVHDIQSRLSILNEEIDLAWDFNLRTFDSSVVGQNYERLCENVESAYKQISRKSRQLVDSIDLLLKC